MKINSNKDKFLKEALRVLSASDYAIYRFWCNGVSTEKIAFSLKSSKGIIDYKISCIQAMLFLHCFSYLNRKTATAG